MTQTTFNNGTGNMTYHKFAEYADQMGVVQAVWLAKYMGVVLCKVRSFVKLYNSAN